MDMHSDILCIYFKALYLSKSLITLKGNLLIKFKEPSRSLQASSIIIYYKFIHSSLYSQLS